MESDMSYDEKNLSELKTKFGLDESDDIAAFMSGIEDFYRKELSDVDGIGISCGLHDCNRKIAVTARINASGREYALAQAVSPALTNYAPIFRGWAAETLANAEKAPIG